jgi:hypothetical protein
MIVAAVAGEFIASQNTNASSSLTINLQKGDLVANGE